MIGIRRRKPHSWQAVLLALMIPVMAFGHGVAGGLILSVGQLAPASSQTPVQQEEEETQSHAKAAAAKAIERRRGRVLLAWRICVLPSLAREMKLAPPRAWHPARPFQLPTTLLLDSDLARRGPPTA